MPAGRRCKPGDRGERGGRPARPPRSLGGARRRTPRRRRRATSSTPPLQAGLHKFQDQHGLDADGDIGKGTLAALNVPAEQRVRQIEINLDRWRWLPHDLGERYIDAIGAMCHSAARERTVRIARCISPSWIGW